MSDFYSIKGQLREIDTPPQDLGTPDHNQPTEKNRSINLEPDDLFLVVIKSSMAKTWPCIPAERHNFR